MTTWARHLYENDYFAIAKGESNGHSFIHKNGYNSDVDATTDPETIWIVAEVIGKKMINTNIEGKILKTDDEQRMVYGWASVVTENGEAVVDRQGDVIEVGTLVKAVNEFMEHVRVGKAMHTGEQVGVVVHSLPITKEIGDALGIQSDREGWVVAYKVFDDAVWAMVKSGELAAFSIGGRAIKEEI